MYNNDGGSQVAGFGREHIYHSCIYDPNDPDGEDLTLDVNFNFSADPQLAYIDPNNVRIRYDSPCRDAGNPLMDYDGQFDMDGRVRVLGTAVDIGAYEIDCEDVSHEWDLNADGVINLYEYANFSRAWLSHDPNDPAWLADPNIADPNLADAWNPMCNLVDTGDSQYTIEPLAKPLETVFRQQAQRGSFILNGRFELDLRRYSESMPPVCGSACHERQI